MNLSVDSLRVFTLNVGYAQHDGDWNWQHVRSPFARLYYVTDGEAKVVIHGEEDRIVALRAGHLYMIPPYTDHSNLCAGPFSHYYIHVYEDSGGDINLLTDMEFPNEIEAVDGDLHLFESLAGLNPFMRLPASDPRSYDNHQTLMRNISVNHQREFFNKVESRGILYILLSRFLKQAREKSEIKDRRINIALAYIREHLTGPIDMSELAAIACMSKDHFIRRFRSEVGETPNSFITHRRMERAELLLITTDMAVKEIAESLGYYDHSYFNRVFHRCVGCTPLKYREQSV